MSNGQSLKLSPSDFKYLWEKCKHCYYRKVIFGISQPSIQIPTIFSKMQNMLQNSLLKSDPGTLDKSLPHGKFILQERYVKSIAVPPDKKVYISGRFDLLTEFEDGTFGVLDAKMTDQKEEDLMKFSRQLHAYKYAFENPYDPEQQKSYQISKMGLLIFLPDLIEQSSNNEVVYRGKPKYMEISEDMQSFLDFIKEIEKLLAGPMPPPSGDCEWCKFKYAC